MESVKRYYELVVRWWAGNALPPQESAAIIQLVIVAFGVVFVLFLWLRYMQYRRMPLWLPATGTVVAVSMFLVTMHLQQSFYGATDDRCHMYHNGNLVFELVSDPMLIATEGNAFDAELVLVLVVRASDRWGDQMHVCSLPARSSLATKLIGSFAEVPLDGDGRTSSSITFTFGSGATPPNVTWDKFELSPEKGEPDIPQDA